MQSPRDAVISRLVARGQSFVVEGAGAAGGGLDSGIAVPIGRVGKALWIPAPLANHQIQADLRKDCSRERDLGLDSSLRLLILFNFGFF